MTAAGKQFLSVSLLTIRQVRQAPGTLGQSAAFLITITICKLVCCLHIIAKTRKKV